LLDCALMSLPLRLLIAAYFLTHALIHTGLVSPRPPDTPGAPPWPFDLLVKTGGQSCS
jgi:hypothetical protein